MKDDKRMRVDDPQPLSSITLLNDKLRVFTIEKVEFYISLSFKEDDYNNYVHTWFVSCYINDRFIIQISLSLYPLTDAIEYILTTILSQPFINTEMFSRYFQQFEYTNKSGALTKGHYYYKKLLSSVYQKPEIIQLMSINDVRINDYLNSIILPSSNSRWKEAEYINTFIGSVTEFNARNKYH